MSRWTKCENPECRVEEFTTWRVKGGPICSHCGTPAVDPYGQKEPLSDAEVVMQGLLFEENKSYPLE